MTFLRTHYVTIALPPDLELLFTRLLKMLRTCLDLWVSFNEIIDSFDEIYLFLSEQIAC